MKTMSVMPPRQISLTSMMISVETNLFFPQWHAASKRHCVFACESVVGEKIALQELKMWWEENYQIRVSFRFWTGPFLN